MAVPLRTALAWRLVTLLERRPVMQQPPDLVRSASERRRRLTRLPGSSVVLGRPNRGAVTTEQSLHLGDGVVVQAQVHRPRRSASGASAVVVNFHGGGWVSGDARQSQWWCSSVAASAEVVVVSVDYRLAPEHPFPVPAEDCYSATAWVTEHAPELGVDPNRLTVMGDSAGANLAAVVAIMARDRGGPAIALQVLTYPSVDLGADYPSKRENAAAPFLGSADIDNAWRLYLHGTDVDPKNPYASPLFADHHDLPPALIQTAQYDPLRDQGPVYAAALRDAGVPVRLTNYVDAVHGFISVPTITVGARQALAEAVEEIRRVLG